jgi:hypothetical protein
VSWSLFVYMSMRQPVEFRVHERHQLIECGLVTIAPGNEQLRHLVWRLGHSVLLPM